MKYAKQFYCLVTLSSEACCLIHDDNISPCICAFVCVFKSSVLRKRRCESLLRKKTGGGGRWQEWEGSYTFARVILPGWYKGIVWVWLRQWEKREGKPHKVICGWKRKNQKESLRNWNENVKSEGGNINALKTLMRYTCIGTRISTDTESRRSSFPPSKSAVITYKNHQQSFKPVDICNQFVMVLCYRSPRNSKSPANPTEHKTAMYLLTMDWITKTCQSNSRNRTSDVTSDGKHLLWQHWLGCGRYCETREFLDAWFSVRIIQQRWQTSLRYMWVDLNNGISPMTRTFFVVFLSSSNEGWGVKFSGTMWNTA